ncbi:beta-lactamase family protein [Lachnospiraceae bacterium OttesenSCG-928-D06]|nr:beta-lactamase family protein [Lachnospiraceae bacterium OttesenSCG-928-D06]
MKKIDLNKFQEDIKELEVKGMVIYQNGEILLRYQPLPEQRQNQYSVTKSFTSTAAAFAVQEHLFDLNDYVIDHFKDDLPGKISQNLKEMKLRHLITMSMGFESPMLMGDMRPKMQEKDWVKFVLKANVVHKPGTIFQYNNAGPYLLGILIQRKAGCSLIDYLTPRLFHPLGIDVPKCEKDPMGNTFGAGGLVINVSELAKLGVLYLQKGVWNGKRILQKEWIEEASKGFIESDGDEEIGHQYGYLFWVMADGQYRADGKYGQYCIVIPDRNAVIAVNSMQTENEKDVLRAVIRDIIPQL